MSYKSFARCSCYDDDDHHDNHKESNIPHEITVSNANADETTVSNANANDDENTGSKSLEDLNDSCYFTIIFSSSNNEN